jgi:hypothetical protein
MRSWGKSGSKVGSLERWPKILNNYIKLKEGHHARDPSDQMVLVGGCTVLTVAKDAQRESRKTLLGNKETYLTH